MALTHWTFRYSAPGLPEAGDIREVTTAESTTLLGATTTTTAAVAACLRDPLAAQLASTQLIELCGAFDHDDLRPLRDAYPQAPIGLVTYAGSMTGGLHELIG